VDVGPFSHLGVAPFRPRGGGDRLTEALQRAVRAAADQIWGADTDMRTEAVKAASTIMGVTFPFGIPFTQRVVGVADDGVWGNLSRAAHDHTTAAMQQALGRPATGIWDQATVDAYTHARSLRNRA
jgi:hypothetical protein